MCHDSAKFCMTPVHCSTQCCTYQKRIWKRINSGLCALSLLCTTTHSHKPEFFLFHILFWYVQHCTEHCSGVMQNFAELWHIFENAHEFCILNKKFLCLQVECCPKGPYIVYLKPFCCTIIPYTHTIFGTPWGHFGVIREWSYDYETCANRFYGSNIV